MGTLIGLRAALCAFIGNPTSLTQLLLCSFFGATQDPTYLEAAVQAMPILCGIDCGCFN
jgi:hypothetical protein